MARFTGAMAAAMLVASVRGARADEADASVAFEAPPTCGTAESFADRVSARFSRAVVASKGARHRVTVVRSGAGFRGTYRVGETRVPERSIDAARCAQVVDALALVVAMAVDESRDVGDGDGGVAVGDGAAAEASQEPRSPADNRPRAREEHATRDDAAPRAYGADSAPTVEAPRVSLESAGTWAILDASGALGVALGAGYAPPRAGYWAPAIHGAVAWQGASRRSSEGGTADLRWWFVSPRACLARTPWSDALLELCGVAQLGAFEVVPGGIRGLERDTSLWLALGSGASLRSFVATDVALDLEADFLAPVHRPLFATVTASGQSEEVYRASGVAMLTSIRVVWLVR